MKGFGERASDRILTVPNALTLLRLIAIPVVLLLLLAKKDASAATVFVLAAVTDYLDGRIARRQGGDGPSYIGTVLDPVADRLMLSSVVVVLAFRGLLPVWVVALLVGRDAFALVGTLAFRGKIRVNKVGKAATAVLMAAVALLMFRPGSVGEIMFYAGLGLSLVAGLLYVGSVKRFFAGHREAGR